MKDIYEKNYSQLGPFHVLLIIFGVALIGAIFSSFYTPGMRGSVLGTKDKNPKSQASVKSSKPNKNSNAKSSVGKSHKAVMDGVVQTLEGVANVEQSYGNSEVSDVLEDVASDAEETAEETVDAVDAVESRPAWKTALLGADYKNLGQLRSSISHITNQIRNLNRTKTSATYQNQNQIDAQLQVLNQEQNRLQTFVHENESSFGILGWFARFLSGYTPEPIGGVVDDIGSTEPDVPIYEEPSETSSTTDSNTLGEQDILYIMP